MPQMITGFSCNTGPCTSHLLESGMIYSIHSNSDYHNEANTHSCACGHQYLSESVARAHNNDTILTIFQIIKVVTSYSAEVKLSVLDINAC